MPRQTGGRSILHLDQINTDMIYKWGCWAGTSIKQHRSLNTSKPSKRSNSELNTPLPDHKVCPQNWFRIEKITVQGEANFFCWYLNHISIKKYSNQNKIDVTCLIFKKQPRQQNHFSFWVNTHTHTTNYCNTALMRWALTMCLQFSILPCQISWKFQYTHR